MRTRIDVCEVCGIINPRLVFDGWIDSVVCKLIIEEKETKKRIYSKTLKETKSKAHYISFNIPLSKATAFNMIAITTDGKKEIFHSFPSTVNRRIIQKIKPKPHTTKLKRQKFSNKNTLDMRNEQHYNQWIRKYENFEPVEEYEYAPLISIVMPVYNVPSQYLEECLDSILQQTYQNLEICIADDCSTNEETIATLRKYQELDSRVKVLFRKENGHISKATNSALSLASGEFVGLMDNDDALDRHALNEVVRVLNTDKEIDFIYTDEDKIDLQGKRSDPHFKSDFSIDSLYGGNFICHFSVIRKTLIDKIGGFRAGYEGAQDFDLFLRLTNETNAIVHIPKILYHWRMIPGSTALESSSKNYAGEAGKRALIDYFAKKNIDVNIETVVNTHYFVEYLYEKEPTVGVVVHVTINDAYKCIDSILNETTYQNYRIIIFADSNLNIDWVENNSNIAQVDIFTVSKNSTFIKEFNHVYKDIDVEHFAFLDQNTIITSSNWLDIMIGYSMQEKIGVVGCKVLDRINMVIKSGIIFDYKAIPMDATLPTYHNDYGVYGRLLVPYNYAAVESICFVVAKNKVITGNSFNSSFNIEFANYDLCLRLLEMGYRNVMIPQIKVKITKQYRKSKKSNNALFMNIWGDKINRDRFYNPNLSRKRVFRLDK